MVVKVEEGVVERHAEKRCGRVLASQRSPRTGVREIGGERKRARAVRRVGMLMGNETRGKHVWVVLGGHGAGEGGEAESLEGHSSDSPPAARKSMSPSPPSPISRARALSHSLYSYLVVFQVGLGLVEVGYSTIDNELKVREIFLEVVYVVVF